MPTLLQSDFSDGSHVELNRGEVYTVNDQIEIGSNVTITNTGSGIKPIIQFRTTSTTLPAALKFKGRNNSMTGVAFDVGDNATGIRVHGEDTYIKDIALAAGRTLLMTQTAKNLTIEDAYGEAKSGRYFMYFGGGASSDWTETYWNDGITIRRIYNLGGLIHEHALRFHQTKNLLVENASLVWDIRNRNALNLRDSEDVEFRNCLFKAVTHAVGPLSDGDGGINDTGAKRTWKQNWRTKRATFKGVKFLGNIDMQAGVEDLLMEDVCIVADNGNQPVINIDDYQGFRPLPTGTLRRVHGTASLNKFFNSEAFAAGLTKEDCTLNGNPV